MPRTVLLSLLVLPLLAACAPTRPSGSPVGPTWVVEDLAGTAAREGVVSTLRLQADGQAVGRGGCNQFFAGYTAEGERLSVGDIGATRMACAEPVMEQETRFFELLRRAERWQIDADGALLISVEGETEPIRLRPEGSAS